MFIMILFSAMYVNYSQSLLTCPSYPLGLGGEDEIVQYSAVDVTRSGTKVVVGGLCKD